MGEERSEEGNKVLLREVWVEEDEVGVGGGVALAIVYLVGEYEIGTSPCNDEAAGGEVHLLVAKEPNYLVDQLLQLPALSTPHLRHLHEVHC